MRASCKTLLVKTLVNMNRFEAGQTCRSMNLKMCQLLDEANHYSSN